MLDQLLDTTAGTGTDIAGQHHSHTLVDIEATVTIIHAKSFQITSQMPPQEDFMTPSLQHLSLSL